ncbi:MAG: hypothetical protein WBM48_11475, partial [Polyangiales bacterium]
MARDLHETWNAGDGSRTSSISLTRGGAQLAPSFRPRGLVQKLAHKADGFLVSQIEKLQPSDLKEPPELVHDLT